MKPSDTLRAVLAQAGPDPLSGLVADLPAEWRGEILGPRIDGWITRIRPGAAMTIKLGRLPSSLRTELAWMAFWQYRDGGKVSTVEINQIAEALWWAEQAGYGRPPSLTALGEREFTKLYQASFVAHQGRLPAPSGTATLQRFLYGRPGWALAARLNTGAWWEMDVWSPRCDPGIPLRAREPRRSENWRPGNLRIPWLRQSVKWHLGTALESGQMTWGTIGGRLSALMWLDRWLAGQPSPHAIAGPAAEAHRLAATFRHWLSDPANRGREAGGKVEPRAINEPIRAVADLMSFLLDNLPDVPAQVGTSPWLALTEAHPPIWRRHMKRVREPASRVREEQYVDDHTLAQITAWLPVLAAPADELVSVSVNGIETAVPGHGDPQSMRILLLQILTGRRASEICLCDFDCLSPATPAAVKAAEGDAVARFHYAQSKIDKASDSIFVDAEVVAVIDEQRRWLQQRFPDASPTHLFLQLVTNAHGTKPFYRSTYGAALRKFSEVAQITDSQGRPFRLSHTHRFRHTKLTKLAELGLPVHVLMRYAGHSNPTMSMHYVARRDEHAEQAFLATRKFKADGTAVAFSREDHDGMQLFNRADRFLPHGYCLLPPLQNCDKGNACLTCSVFVTDSSHLDTLQRQLAETEALIQRHHDQFQARHGRPMPEDNVWLVQRAAERDALVKLLATMQETPERPCQGAGSPTSGPTPITIDITRHRRTQP
ncbi:tyrosine-type recombinase/integrase [Streptomyces ureilyticus]|uniref:Tyrosine-type recombinase/integrase n=1 Tax=Streptomyces ureilyticus TaxID=1775131 RepID=A0ABX0DLT3_9ACTN|nr:tyrosine-type recombinase/integrase [Streptomyces ureilyticus]NGO41699.1 tyrosine-type recombinase/integrase [Streptomyces ureilyticus]